MDEMTSKERIDAAIALEPVDRVPIIPLIDYSVARSRGIDIATFLSDPDLSLSLLMETFDQMGGWDATAMPNVAGGLGLFPMATLPVKMPGKQLPPDSIPQFDEREIMTVEDYDYVIEHGWNDFTMYAYPRIGFDITIDELPEYMANMGGRMAQDIKAWEDKGVMIFTGAATIPPIESLALSRSIKELMIDLYRRPDKVFEAIEVMIDESIESTIGAQKMMEESMELGPRVAFLGASRSTLLSPKLFDRFVWPHIEKQTLAWLDAGITPMFHFDANWDSYMDYFLRLPPRSVILELDSATDIFKAKEVLKGHTCIMGDVPPSLLSLGTPEEVTAYVKKLIDVVGDENGFILSSGCSIPVDAKTENVQAMIDTGKNYYPH